MELMFSIGTIILVSILAWITPGPNMFAVITSSLKHGRQHGLVTGLGLACGALIWATLALLGVAILFDLFPTAVLFLKLSGAAYLVWLGINSIKNARKRSNTLDLESPHIPTWKKAFSMGFTVSMTNPKAALFYGSVMATFVPVTAPNWFFVLVVVISGMLAVILHSITATLFSTDIAIQFFDRFKHAISYVFGAIFITLGSFIAYDALRRTS